MVLIIGDARHGKDTFAQMLRDRCDFLTFKSSSMAALETFLYRVLTDKYGLSYDHMGEAFEDRVNHRAIWFKEISFYNSGDKARLARQILLYSKVYVGMRKRDELEECKKQGLFKLVIWVDASDRLPSEHHSSAELTKADAHIIVDNNGSEGALKEKADVIADLLDSVIRYRYYEPE